MFLTRVLIVALVVALGATPVVRALARRFGFIARPTGDRWHRQPTALLGGVAVGIATLVAFLVSPWPPPGLVVLGAASLAMFVTGLVDDLVRLRPATKLTLQIAAASAVVWGGVRLGWTESLTIDSVLTLFWLIAATNAFNLVDNMDGACAGVGAIAAGALCVLGLMSPAGAGPESLMAAAVCGALIGFLVFNFRPASIFLGDSGSLFVGLLLGGLTAWAGARANHPVGVVVVPVLVLAVPIFDTMLVTVARKLSGRPASQGGTDHTAHRLVALGFSEVNAVLFLYVVAALSGIGAIALNQATSGSDLFVVALALGLMLLAAALLRVRAYGGRDYSLLLRGRLSLGVVEFLFRHHVFEVLFDLLLVAGAYYASYRIRFDAAHFPLFFPTFLLTLPIVIGCQAVSLWLSGAYGMIWRYFGPTDLVPIARGVVVGAASSSLLLVYLYRFENVSRGVFLIYAVLLATLLICSRLALRLLPELAGGRSSASGRRQALVYGAGDAGEMLVREFAHNSRYGFHVVGFLDDDAKKTGRKVRGVPVLGGGSALAAVIASRQVDAVILSSDRIDPAVVAAVAEACRREDLPLLRFRCVLDEVVPALLEDEGRPPVRLGAAGDA
jgi:UDP-GlcNAc:undecaprenyl-phosphate/decaprenyl-phosphate GlcNAc-1-phosphate transferase